MKQNKGFTLIELLAVIVILAIIALIVTPVILNVINEAREKSAMDSGYGYIDAVEKYIALENLHASETGSVAAVPVNDTCKLDATTDPCKKLFEGVKVKGRKPESATIVFENGTVKSAEMKFAGVSKTVKYDGSVSSLS